MKVVHFDPFAGASGDMVLGALLGAGVPLPVIAAAVEKVVPGEAALSQKAVTRGGLAGTQCEVALLRDTVRQLPGMLQAVEGAGLAPAVRDLALAALSRLGEAEARVHGQPGTAHLHEMGSTDTLVDVVGAAAGIAWLAPARITVGPVNVGSGTVRCAHGELPVPPPATAELLKGATVFSRGPAFELTTPTGAALLSTFAARLGGHSHLPALALEAVGLGAGTREFAGFPNLLRVFVGSAGGPAGPSSEEAVVIEVGLDDASPEYLAPLSEALHAAGAREVMVLPAQGKKGRLGVLLRVLGPVEKEGDLVEAVLEETGSPGARWHRVLRRTLPREVVTVDTPWGPVRVKWWMTPAGRLRAKPEFEDCAALGQKAGVAPSEVRDAALSSFLSRKAKP